MRQRLMSLTMGLMLVLSIVAATSAQEMAPRDISLLKGLGLPEINLVASDTDVTGAPAELAAGRYLVTLENQTADTEVEIYLISPPAGLTLEQATIDVNANADGPPAWVYDAALAGGPNPYGGQTDGVVADLSPGEWWVAAERYVEPAVWTLMPVTVTGVAPAVSEVAGAVPVSLQEYAFVLPEKMSAGQQIWQVTNTGNQPHFFVLVKVPDGTTANALMTFLMSMDAEDTGGPPAADTATPATTGLREEDFAFIYDSSIVSAGQTTWVQVGLERGTYGLICWFSDKESGAPHVAMGMVNVFTVE